MVKEMNYSAVNFGVSLRASSSVNLPSPQQVFDSDGSDRRVARYSGSRINKNHILQKSQYDWENYWKNTAVPFRGTWLSKTLVKLLAFYSARSSLKLLRGIQEDISSILELGGGTGCLSAAITSKLTKNSKSLTLIDGVKEAKQVWKELSRFGKYIIGDFTTYNFKKNRFDLVFSAGLIEHWQNETERLQIIQKHSLLSKNYVMIRVPKQGGMVKILELKEKSQEGGNFEKHYTQTELKKEMIKAGLKVLSTSEDLIAVVALAKIK